MIVDQQLRVIVTVIQEGTLGTAYTRSRAVCHCHPGTAYTIMINDEQLRVIVTQSSKDSIHDHD